MNTMEAMRARHSVRQYTDQKIEGEVLASLRDILEECNARSGLHMQLCLNEPEGFSGRMARYGRFENVRNYISIIGRKEENLDEKCGYYGEKVVIAAQQLGLRTCWVAMSYNKSKSKQHVVIGENEKLVSTLSIGYGKNDGQPSKSKPIDSLCKLDAPMPDWFRSGMEMAQLAPTAMNQQKFCFILHGDAVTAKAGRGMYTKLDLGIAKYHFAVGAGRQIWSEVGQ